LYQSRWNAEFSVVAFLTPFAYLLSLLDAQPKNFMRIKFRPPMESCRAQLGATRIAKWKLRACVSHLPTLRELSGATNYKSPNEYCPATKYSKSRKTSAKYHIRAQF